MNYIGAPFLFCIIIVTSINNFNNSIVDLFIIRCISGNIVLISKIWRNELVMPKFNEFKAIIEDGYNKVKDLKDGKVIISIFVVLVYKYQLSLQMLIGSYTAYLLTNRLRLISLNFQELIQTIGVYLYAPLMGKGN